MSLDQQYFLCSYFIIDYSLYGNGVYNKHMYVIYTIYNNINTWGEKLRSHLAVVHTESLIYTRNLSFFSVYNTYTQE